MWSKLLIAGVAFSVFACTQQEAPAPAGEPRTGAEPSSAETSRAQDVPASAADSGLSIKRGVVMLAQDRSTFRPCEEAAELWVLDQTDGVLAQAFANSPRTTPTMLYVEAYGERTAVSEEEPPQARSYGGVFVLEEVLYAGAQDQVKGCGAPPPPYIVAARGTEPFWAVEVHEEQIVWRQPEAPREISLAAPQMEDAEGVVRYRARNDEHDIEVLIESQSCRDAMSGEFFAYAARGVLDGREFSGCARLGK